MSPPQWRSPWRRALQREVMRWGSPEAVKGGWGTLASGRCGWAAERTLTSTDLLARAVRGRLDPLGRLGVHQRRWTLPGVTAAPHRRWLPSAPRTGLLSRPAGQPAGAQDLTSQGQLPTTEGGKDSFPAPARDSLRWADRASCLKQDRTQWCGPFQTRHLLRLVSLG